MIQIVFLHILQKQLVKQLSNIFINKIINFNSVHIFLDVHMETNVVIFTQIYLVNMEFIVQGLVVPIHILKD